MFRVLQIGRKINTSFVLFGRLVLKRYVSKQRMERDIAGAQIWRDCSEAIVPKFYFKIGSWAVWEYIPNSGFDEVGRALDMLAHRYSEVKYNFPDSNSIMVADWESYIEDLASYLDSGDYIDRVSTSTIVRLRQRIIYLQGVDWTLFRLYPLHRDLCKTNFLKTDSGTCLIDFEHHLVAPIEYEFCNSVFWNDYASLSVDKAVETLREQGVYLSRWLMLVLCSLYFLDQLRLAERNSDAEKLQLLIGRYKSVEDEFDLVHSNQLVDGFSLGLSLA